MIKQSKAELLAPVGSFASLVAAIEAGADAVYFGIGHLNMRSGCSQTFTPGDLLEISSISKKHNIKSYVTLNTVVYNNEVTDLHKLLGQIKEAGINGIIATDYAVINKAKELSIPLTISTQSNISNIEAVKFFSSIADVMVLARELSLKQILSICEQIEQEQITGPSGELVKVEVFAHGALCIAISGKCYMSLTQYDKSANRGACLQACRRKYTVTEEETGKQLTIDNKYIMSPRDLCTIGILDQIMESGVSILKIEGRGRSPEYVSTVIQTYREAIDAVYDDTYSQEKVDQWKNQLKKVYNRGFWDNGYYLGNHLDSMANCHGSKATEKKSYVGKVSNYYKKSQIVECTLQAGNLSDNDEIYLIGKNTGVKRLTIKNLKPHEDTESGYRVVTFPCSEKVRRNDEIYLIQKRER